MSAPATTLNQAYSDPAATAVEWDETRRVLETAELFWISTVRADGRPHVTPVVAAWVEGAVWFCTGADEQKFANLRGNPHVVLTTGCNGWDGGLDVVVEGDAVRVTDDVVLSRVAEAFTAKWDGRWQYTARDGCFHDADGRGEALVFSVTPVKVFAHAKGDPFGATTHRFRPGGTSR
jgi:general stress protein 26